jgi:hypothetical protein
LSNDRRRRSSVSCKNCTVGDFCGTVDVGTVVSDDEEDDEGEDEDEDEDEEAEADARTCTLARATSVRYTIAFCNKQSNKRQEVYTSIR